MFLSEKKIDAENELEYNQLTVYRTCRYGCRKVASLSEGRDNSV